MVATMTIYTLMWPVIVAGTLATIIGAFVKEVRAAKREGKKII